MHCPILDTLFSLLFSCGYPILIILFPLRKLFEWLFYKPTFGYFNAPKRTTRFQRDISELQHWPDKPLKARAGLMIFGCCFYGTLMFFILKFLTQNFNVVSFFVSLLILSLLSLFFWLCWKMAFYPLYTLNNRKDEDILKTEELSPLSNGTLNWFFCEKYQAAEKGLWMAALILILNFVIILYKK